MSRFRARTAAFAVLAAAAIPATAVASGELVDEGRMTGGGHTKGTSFGKSVKVTHGFELRCDEDDHRQNLQVNWSGNRFHLTEVENIECRDSFRDEEQPEAGFDLLEGTGTGRYNGVDGARIDWKVADDGEPGGGADEFRVWIWDAAGNLVLHVPTGTEITSGNHQAHRETGN